MLQVEIISDANIQTLQDDVNSFIALVQSNGGTIEKIDLIASGLNYIATIQYLEEQLTS